MADVARMTGRAAVLSRLFAVSLLLLLAVSPRAFAASATVHWAQNTEPYLAGYKVHYGLASHAYQYHVDAGKALSRTISNLAGGKTYYFAVSAYDRYGNESACSAEVSLTTTGGGAETITKPLAPSGPAAGLTGVAYTYTAQGAASSSGDPVQYRFSWSDGSVSGWLPAGVTIATKSWSAPGVYALVFVEARCALHPSVVSNASPSRSVTISGAPVETISAPVPPSGPASGVVGTAYTFATGGSVSSTGDPIQYRFSWSDGSVSDWLPAAAAFAAKTWNAPGTYSLVRAQARCALHQSVVSAQSAATTVTISSGIAETVSAPSIPAGPSAGTAGVSYSFSTGGAASSAAHPVQHRFDWGDGTVSDWIGPGQTATAAKTWSAPGTYLVRAEAACATHPAISALSEAIEVAIAAAAPAPPAAFVLWTRGDTGQAVLAQVDSSAPPGAVSVDSSAFLQPAAGLGAHWRATGFARIDAATANVLWTRDDDGQSELWTIGVGGDTLPTLGVASLAPPPSEGGPWQATDYEHVDATTGYLLWTRADTGQAELWKVDPSAANAVTVLSSASLQSPAGSGGPWQAAGYSHADATTGYVLWTRSDTGQSQLWKIDPGAAGTIPAISTAELTPPSGSVGPWEATDYTHAGAANGYVLWTRADTGQSELWKVDLSVDGAVTVVGSADLSGPSGAGGPWQAASYSR